MPSQQENLLRTAWIRDRLDCDDPPEIEACYFDRDLHAWVVTRYIDIQAAFHNPSLIPGRRDLTSLSLDSEEDLRPKMREEVRDALCPVRTRAWREELGARSDSLCTTLPIAEPIDLMDAYARPLCLQLAAMVTGITQSDADKLEGLAQVVSAATAEPEDLALHAQAEDANRALRSHFSQGPESLRDSGFVGLSQTLLRLVSAAWVALVQFPDQYRLLRGSPHLLDQAMDELLRYAGVIRMLWRTAKEDISLNGTRIRKGDHLLLRVFAGSHDPERIERPEVLDCTRPNRHHFVFGAGGHACVAASLIRMAAITITAPIVMRFATIELAHPVEWHGGSVMRSPASLWVILQHGD